MRSTSWFTSPERVYINSYLPELRRLKETVRLGQLTEDGPTRYEMTVAAELRLRISRYLVRRYPRIYGNLKDPKTFFRITTLDSRLKLYFEYKLRKIEAVRPQRAAKVDVSNPKESHSRHSSTAQTSTSAAPSPVTSTQDTVESRPAGPSSIPKGRPTRMTGKFKVASSRKHALIKGHGKRVDKAEHSGKRAKLCAKMAEQTVGRAPSPATDTSSIIYIGRRSPPPADATVGHSKMESITEAFGPGDIIQSDPPNTGSSTPPTTRTSSSPSVQAERASLFRTPRTGRLAFFSSPRVPTFQD